MWKLVILTFTMSFMHSLKASPIVVDANNRFVGFYQGASENPQQEHAVSQAGYRFGFDRETGRVLKPEGISASVGVGRVFYSTTNCTGQAYLQADPGVKLGIVIAAAIPDFDGDAVVGTPLLYFIAQTQRPSPEQVEIRSQWAFLGTGPDVLSCFNGFSPGQIRTAVPLIPNNPSETGVPDAGFVPPLRIMSSWLFRDGFETLASGIALGFSRQEEGA